MIRITGLTKDYHTEQGSVRALKGISLEVKKGEFCVLLGPSGCGKTTTLRCVAGLERPDSGEIVIEETVVSSHQRQIHIPPEDRGLGMIFQSYAIWPHLDVFHNIALPLEYGKRKVSSNEIKDRVREAVDLVHLEGLEERRAVELSGGQQQRVALARAFAGKPKVLLMDEPLSNLDAKLREEMRSEIKQIASSIGITVLYVTHDQSEALVMADVVAVMWGGLILQRGSPEELYSRPANLEVAEFLGDMNFIKGRKVGGELRGPHQVETPLGRFRIYSELELPIGEGVVLGIRPEDVQLYGEKPPSNSAVMAAVVNKQFLGNMTIYELQSNGVPFSARAAGRPALTLLSEEKLFAEFDPSWMHLFRSVRSGG
jgi:iron(III) transport system ATP-binding protein